MPANSDERLYTHEACNFGRLEFLTELIRSGEDPNRKDGVNGNIALHYACRNCHLNCAQYLVENRLSDVNAKNSAGNTPLHFCTIAGSKKVAQLLLEHGADINAKNDSGQTPLHGAVGQNWEHVVRFLGSFAPCSKNTVESIKEISSLAAKNASSLLSTSDSTLPESAPLEPGSNPVAENKKTTPCKECERLAREREKKRANDSSHFCRKHELDLNAQDEHGRTPLHYASELFFSDAMFNLLVKLGAKMDIKEKYGGVPIRPSVRWRKWLSFYVPLFILLFAIAVALVLKFISIKAKDEIEETDVVFFGSKLE